MVRLRGSRRTAAVERAQAGSRRNLVIGAMAAARHVELDAEPRGVARTFVFDADGSPEVRPVVRVVCHGQRAGGQVFFGSRRVGVDVSLRPAGGAGDVAQPDEYESHGSFLRSHNSLLDPAASKFRRALRSYSARAPRMAAPGTYRQKK